MTAATPAHPRPSSLARLAAAVAVALLAFPAAALAARDPVASGATDLHLKRGMVRKLSNNQIAVFGVGAGNVGGTKIGLPVASGMLDPTDVQGHLEARGGFKLQRGNRGVVVNALTVNTVKGAVYARVAKARMQIGSFQPPTAAREGFGANFKAGQLALTEKAARRLSNRLGLRGSHRLRGGRVLSNLYSSAQPATVTLLAKGSATVDLDRTALRKLAAKGVKAEEGIGAIAPATETKPSSFQVPIAGGSLAPDASRGAVQLAGGVQVQKKTATLSPTVAIRDAIVDLGARSATVTLEITPAPPFPGPVGQRTVADLVLPANSVKADPVARTIAIAGAQARLRATAATTLNGVFDQPPPEPPAASDFLVGDPLATLSLTAQAQ